MFRRIKNKTIHIINKILLLITLGLFVALIILALNALVVGVEISLTKEGVLGFQTYWLAFGPIVKAFIAFLTLTIASVQLKRYVDIETVTALAKLRELLMSEKNMEVHSRIINGNTIVDKENSSADEKEDNSKITIREIDVYNYLGTLELGAIMVKRGTVTIDEFSNQFGYRVKEVMSNKEVLDNYINKESYYYNDLMNIWNKLLNHTCKK